MDTSKRAFLQAIAAMVVEQLGERNLFGRRGRLKTRLDRRLIIVIPGGIRRQETFSERGKLNIPHLYDQLLPTSLFYSDVRNEGDTSHFNSIASILTGNWQHVDDWGNERPATPTLFEYARRQMGLLGDEAWMVTSNKALTYRIGSSSAGSYKVQPAIPTPEEPAETPRAFPGGEGGVIASNNPSGYRAGAIAAETFSEPYWGANVVFPKVMLLTAVENAIKSNHQRSLADRREVQRDIDSVLEGNNYEGLGWNISGQTNWLNSRLKASVKNAIQQFVHTNTPATGDELTFFVAVEIMRKYAPSLLVLNFSDVEVAHFGPYSLHLEGIRTVDRLIYELWQEICVNSEYRGKTLMVVTPEFGRDPDGSDTNGFFNHRSYNESCRLVWMMCLGQPIARRQIIDRPIEQVDVCPSLAHWLGCQATQSKGRLLGEIANGAS